MNSSERSKKIREFLGLSQQKFADAVGFGYGTINSIENGTQKEFSLPLALSIHEKYGMDLIWILYGKGEMFPQKANSMEVTYYPVVERMADWGKRLQEIQLEHGFSDEQFAKVLNFSLKKLLELCLNSPRPEIDDLLSIKENFNVTLDWLLFGEDTELCGDKSQDSLAEMGLSKSDLIKLKKLLNK